MSRCRSGTKQKAWSCPISMRKGTLRGKFEAGTAKRIDEEHIGFRNLKITTYTPEKQHRSSDRYAHVGVGFEDTKS